MKYYVFYNKQLKAKQKQKAVNKMFIYTHTRKRKQNNKLH